MFENRLILANKALGGGGVIIDFTPSEQTPWWYVSVKMEKGGAGPGIGGTI